MTLPKKISEMIQKMDLEDVEKERMIKYSEKVYALGFKDGEASKGAPPPAPPKKKTFFEQLDEGYDN